MQIGGRGWGRRREGGREKDEEVARQNAAPGRRVTADGVDLSLLFFFSRRNNVCSYRLSTYVQLRAGPKLEALHGSIKVIGWKCCHGSQLFHKKRSRHHQAAR